MQISSTGIIIVIILHLNIFELHVESLENKNNFQAYLKKTFSVLKNERLSRNMRSLLNNLKQDDFRKKYYRRKKQILVSSSLKDHPLFLLEEPKPNVQLEGLHKLDSLLANPLIAKNYVQSQTRSSNSLNGIDLNAIDKTDAQIVGALYYPASDENSMLQIEPTDSSSTDSFTPLPATALNNAPPNFGLNQNSEGILIPTNNVPKQTEYYNNNDYLKSYLENIKMLPIYSNIAASPIVNPSVVAPTPNAVGDYLKRCSTETYDSSQKEGLYNIFSDIYNHLKLNYMVTPTTPVEPINDNKENNVGHSVNLTHADYSGTANKPNCGSSSSNSEYQNRKLLNPEKLETIMLTIKNLIDNQNRKLSRCNSNLPKSYENVLTPQLMAIMLNSLSNNIIPPKKPSAQQLNANDYLDKYVSKSTSEKSLPEENYLEKLPRFNLPPRLDNSNFHVDLDSQPVKPETSKNFIYTNPPKSFQLRNIFKPSRIRSERSTTLKQKGMNSKQQFELHHVDHPKLSIFSNLNFPKRCENGSGDNEKTNEKESFNTSSAIEEILKIVQDMRNKEKQLSEDVNCNILGSWSSMAGGMLLNVSKCKDILDVTLSQKSPPGKKGFLMDAGWIIKGVQPIPKTNLIILTGTNLNSKHVIVFIGECRVCGGSELVTGNWLIGRCSHNCQDQKASQDLLSDVWRREMLTKLCHDRLHALANGHNKTATTPADIKETSTDNNASTSSNDEVSSDETTTADEKSDTTDKTTNESQSHDEQVNTPCKTTNELHTKEPKLDTTTKTSNESHAKDRKSESTCAIEDDLNFLFSSSSVAATTASSENIVTEKAKPSILGNIEGNSSQDAEVEKMQQQKSHSDNKMFTICNYNGPTTKQHHDHTEKATTTKFTTTKTTTTTTTTTPTTTTCEDSTTENCNSSPSTSCEESTIKTTSCEESNNKTTSCEESANKTTSCNKCVVQVDIQNTTKKAKFLNKVIHIFKNKSKTTSEKCSTTDKCSTTEKCTKHTTECN